MTVDDREFEELTKAMADGQSRRRIVKILGAGVLSGLAGLFGSEASAKKRAKGAQPGCRREGHPCEGNQECCPGLECRVTGPGNAERCAKPTTTTKKPTTTTKKPTTTTKKPTTTTKRPHR